MRNLDYLAVLNYIMPQITETTIKCGDDYIDFDGYMARSMRMREQQADLVTHSYLRVLFPYERVTREAFWQFAHGNTDELVSQDSINLYRQELQKLLTSKINMNPSVAAYTIKKGLNDEGYRYSVYHQRARHPICHGCYTLRDQRQSAPEITILDQPMWFLGDIFNLTYKKNSLNITVDRNEPSSNRLATSLSIAFDLDSSSARDIRSALNSACPLYESLPELSSVLTPALFTKQAVKEAEQSL